MYYSARTSRHRQNGLSYVPKKILTWMLREARGALKGGHPLVKNTGGWLDDSLGSRILVAWEKIFWGSSKILIWAIVRG